MSENQVIINNNVPEDAICDNRFYKIQSQFINTLSENKLTIAQTRYLFNTIVSQFEKEMPVTNHRV